MRDWKYHCAVLGIREGATPKEVRRAYRRLALERHPDKHNNSTKAKEEFQQLNESYRYLLDTIAQGGRPSPAPAQPARPAAPSAPFDRDGPTNPKFHPTTMRSTAPAVRPAIKKSWMLWVNVAAICATLLGASVWVELARNHEPAIRRDTRDLSQHAYCKIADTDGKIATEFSTEPTCIARCQLVPGASCDWNNNPIGGAKPPVPAPASVNPLDTIASKAKENSGNALSCKITLKRTPTSEQGYSAATESSCRVVCDSLKDSFPHAELHCLYGDREFAQQAAFQPHPEDPTDPRLTAAYRNLDETEEEIDYAHLCLIAVLVPGDPEAIQFNASNIENCISRCSHEELAKPHAEIQCNYAGRQLHIRRPDPLNVYMAEHPEALREAQANGTTTIGTCRIVASTGGRQMPIVIEPMQEAECGIACARNTRVAAKETRVNCTFEGKPVKLSQ